LTKSYIYATLFSLFFCFVVMWWVSVCVSVLCVCLLTEAGPSTSLFLKRYRHFADSQLKKVRKMEVDISKHELGEKYLKPSREKREIDSFILLQCCFCSILVLKGTPMCIISLKRKTTLTFWTKANFLKSSSFLSLSVDISTLSFLFLVFPFK